MLKTGHQINDFDNEEPLLFGSSKVLNFLQNVQNLSFFFKNNVSIDEAIGAF